MLDTWNNSLAGDHDGGADVGHDDGDGEDDDYDDDNDHDNHLDCDGVDDRAKTKTLTSRSHCGSQGKRSEAPSQNHLVPRQHQDS